MTKLSLKDKNDVAELISQGFELYPFLPSLRRNLSEDALSVELPTPLRRKFRFVAYGNHEKRLEWLKSTSVAIGPTRFVSSIWDD